MPNQEGILTISREDLDADTLYDVSMWLSDAGAQRMARRVEIERRNFIQHDDYEVKFTTSEWAKIGLALLIHYLTEDSVTLEYFEDFPKTLCKVADQSDVEIDREAEIFGFEPVHDEPLDIFKALNDEQQLQRTE